MRWCTREHAAHAEDDARKGLRTWSMALTRDFGRHPLYYYTYEY